MKLYRTCGRAFFCLKITLKIIIMKKFSVDANGYYGEFGGAFVPQELQPCIDELASSYLQIIESDEFQKEYRQLLRDYVGRPSPLYRATRLCEYYNTNIYLKREDLNHTGAHKINNAVGQILIAKHMGKKQIIAETGAGQHGVATATVCALAGMKCRIFMGKVDVDRQYMNVERMRMLGAEVVAVTEGTMTLCNAVDAAIGAWVESADESFYLLGSAVGPHPYPDMVARLQSVISEEIKSQLLEQTGSEDPNYLVACIGGGSNAAGTIYHHLDVENVKIILAEAGGLGLDSGSTAASINFGSIGVLHGSRSYVMLDEDDNLIEPYSVSAGLDYPGIGPLHAHLAMEHRVEVLAINDDEALTAGLRLTRMEGIIPAIESAHAVAVLDRVKFKPTDVVVVTVSGRGDKDLSTYLEFAQKGGY